MKKILIGLSLVALMSNIYAASFSGSRSSVSSFRPSTSYSNIILPMTAMMLLMNDSKSTPEQKLKTYKENGILDMQSLHFNIKNKEDCIKLSKENQYAVSYREDKKWCYVFNKR